MRLTVSRNLYLVTGLLLIAACGSPGPIALQHLDQETGVTITRAEKPLVLYRDRSAQSAHGRDYVYLGPIEVNNMGRRHYYLWLGIWGTADNRVADVDDFESIVMFVDGEPMSLEATGWTPGAIGASGSVYVKPVAAATDAYYSVTIDQIRLMAEAGDIELRAGTVRTKLYTQWDTSGSTSANILAFVKRVY